MKKINPNLAKAIMAATQMQLMVAVPVSKLPDQLSQSMLLHPELAVYVGSGDDYKVQYHVDKLLKVLSTVTEGYVETVVDFLAAAVLDGEFERNVELEVPIEHPDQDSYTVPVTVYRTNYGTGIQIAKVSIVANQKVDFDLALLSKINCPVGTVILVTTDPQTRITHGVATGVSKKTYVSNDVAIGTQVLLGMQAMGQLSMGCDVRDPRPAYSRHLVTIAHHSAPAVHAPAHHPRFQPAPHNCSFQPPRPAYFDQNYPPVYQQQPMYPQPAPEIFSELHAAVVTEILEQKTSKEVVIKAISMFNDSAFFIEVPVK